MSEIDPFNTTHSLSSSVELPDNYRPAKLNTLPKDTIRYLGAHLLAVDSKTHQLIFDGDTEPDSDTIMYRPGRFALTEVRAEGHRGFLVDIRELQSGDIKSAKAIEDEDDVSEKRYPLINEPTAVQGEIFTDPAGFVQYVGPEEFEIAALHLFDRVNDARRQVVNVPLTPDVVAKNALQHTPDKKPEDTTLPRDTLDKITFVLNEYALKSGKSPDKAA